MTPLAFLERVSDVFADKTAIAYGERRMTYGETKLSTTQIGGSWGTDYFGLRDEQTEAELGYLERTREFVLPPARRGLLRSS